MGVRFGLTCCGTAHPPSRSAEKKNDKTWVATHAMTKSPCIFALNNPIPCTHKPQAREVHEEVLQDEEDLRHREGEGTKGGPGSHLGYQVRPRRKTFFLCNYYCSGGRTVKTIGVLRKRHHSVKSDFTAKRLWAWRKIKELGNFVPFVA